MATHRRAWSVAGVGVWVLALAGAGCAPLDLGAGWRAATQTAPPPNPSGLPANNAPPSNTPAAATTANHAPPPNKPDAPPAAAFPPACPGGVVPASYDAPSQVLAMLSQKLAAADDERKILIARLHQLEATLEARDQALAASAQEIAAAQAEIAATRADMERWKRDMIKLRDKARTMEKENLGTLQSIISMLEQVVENEPEAGPAGKPAPPPGRPRERSVDRP